MLVVLDTNVLVQAIIGSPRAASTATLLAYRDKKYQLAFSAETLHELHNVLSLPTMISRHQWLLEDFNRYYTFLRANSVLAEPTSKVSASITRDVTDAKLLSLAKEVSADFLVTNDRRHLLRLKAFGVTQIVTPTQFLAALNA